MAVLADYVSIVQALCCVRGLGRLDARQKLDQILLSVSNKCQLLENAEMTAVRCVMLEEHARFCIFVDCMKPLMACVAFSL